MEPKLLGWFGEGGSREVALRRLLIALRASPVTLAALGPLIPGRGRQGRWFDFVSRFAFWRAARRSMSRAEWTRITRDLLQASPTP